MGRKISIVRHRTISQGFTFLVVLLVVFTTGCAPKISSPLWQIGQSDNSAAEFALAPSGKDDYATTFDDTSYYLVGLSDSQNGWPYVFPGPLDKWGGTSYYGGKQRHLLTVYFNLKAVEASGTSTLTVDFVETPAEFPPLFRATVNGYDHTVQLPKGNGEAALDGEFSKGRECVLNVKIPNSQLRPGVNSIVLNNVQGSWVVFDSIQLACPEGIRLAQPNNTLIHSVRAADFEMLQDGKRVQPLLVEVTQRDKTESITIEVDGSVAATKSIEPGRSVLEVYLHAVEDSLENKVRITKADEELFRATVERKTGNLITRADYVDPFLGTANSRWMLTPGPTMPFGMVQLAPDNEDLRWKAGYDYAIENIMGFSHIHEWTMEGLLMMPTVGPLQTAPGPELEPDLGYRSRFDRSTETGGIGYYGVTLKDYGIRAELTATTRAGLQRYTFPESDQARVLVDLLIPSEYKHEVREAKITRTSDTEIVGYSVQHCSSTGYACVNDYILHFVIQFSRPFESMGGWKGDIIDGDTQELKGAGDVGVFLNFKTQKGDVILARSGISLVSIDQARLNLTKEIIEPFDWDFEAVVQNSKKTWNDIFDRIQIETDDYLQKVKFYTNLYRSYSARPIWSDVNGKWVDPMERVQQLPRPGDVVYGGDSYWNTFWNFTPLYNLVTPEISNSWVRSLIEIYDKGGWLPKGPAGIEYTSVMIAEHAIPIIVSAYQNGIRDYDVEKAYEAIRHVQTTPAQPYAGGGHVGNKSLEDYLKYGYIPAGKRNMSNVLEYSFDDFCAGQMALALGHQDDYEMFMKRSENWRNIFDKETGFMRPKDENGQWTEPFNPYHTPGFVEGNSWQYTWFVPHNVPALIEEMGKERFVERLNEGFEKSEKARFNAIGDNFRKYPLNHGNEPAMQVCYLFNYAGAPWLTQKWARQIQEKYYGLGPSNGYPGDEDQGQMSSWFVMSAMGLFQMDGGTTADPVYCIGSPRFPKVRIRLNPNYFAGPWLEIEAQNASRENCYIQSATLNEKPLDTPFFHRSDIAKGGKLILVMGPAPNKKWAADDKISVLMENSN